MFSRFNPAARRVLRAAEQASRNHNHYYIGVGHVVLALLDEDDAAIAARLDTLALVRSEFAAALRLAIGTGDDRGWDGILVTPRVRAAIVVAEERASHDGAIAPIDLFDAVLASDGGLVHDVVTSLRREAVVAREATR